MYEYVHTIIFNILSALLPKSSNRYKLLSVTVKTATLQFIMYKK